MINNLCLLTALSVLAYFAVPLTYHSVGGSQVFTTPLDVLRVHQQC